MNNLENILICIGVPFLLALFFTKGKQRQDLAFILCGMAVSLLSAYVTPLFYDNLQCECTGHSGGDYTGL